MPLKTSKQQAKNLGTAGGPQGSRDEVEWHRRYQKEREKEILYRPNFRN